MRRWQYAALSFVSTMFGTVALALAYIYGTILGPDVTTYLAFQPTTREVARGADVELLATYRKRLDCGGSASVSLDDAHPTEGPRIIKSIPLGDRPPGQWSVTRKIAIPSDAAPGPARLQETLVYYCGWRTQIIRSPPIQITIKE